MSPYNISLYMPILYEVVCYLRTFTAMTLLHPSKSQTQFYTRKIPVISSITGILYILSAKSDKRWNFKACEVPKPQFTAVNEDLRDKCNAEITLFADFGLLVQGSSYIHCHCNSTSNHRVVSYSQESHHFNMGGNR